MSARLTTILLALAVSGCETAKLPFEATVGPDPQGGTPAAAAGLSVNAFADGLDHPRWLHVLPNRDVLVAAPDYALGNHVAPLGLAFYDGALLPRFSGGALVGEHGSWNRRPLSGYKVVFVPFADGRPSGPPQDVLTGFVDDGGNARGRPVGVAIAADGAVLVADDVGNVVWRVTPSKDAGAR